jgi:hypothetical protein
MEAGGHAVDELLQACQQSQKLSAAELAAVRSKWQVLIEQDILSADTIRSVSYQQLVDCGLSPGVADCLKRVFSTGGRWCWVSGFLLVLWA